MEPTIDTYSRFCIKQIVASVRKCLMDADQRREFEQWYREQYGKEYTWNYPIKKNNWR